jgi:uncharacterized membrane protein
MDADRPALMAVIVGVLGVVWSLRLLSWFISAQSIQACFVGTTTCPSVFATSFSQFLGIPIHVYAVVWFAALTGMAVLRIRGNTAMSRCGTFVAALSLPTVAYLDYVQLCVINAICWDCVLAHILGLFLFGLFLAMYVKDRRTSAIAQNSQ